jgi:hypothetical protein
MTKAQSMVSVDAATAASLLLVHAGARYSTPTLGMGFRRLERQYLVCAPLPCKLYLRRRPLAP